MYDMCVVFVVIGGKKSKRLELRISPSYADISGEVQELAVLNSDLRRA